MLNKNPLWRYILVPGLLLLALLYALPNLYPEDPALNISARGGAVITEQQRTELEQQFEHAGIAAKSLLLTNGRVLARFNSTEDQLQARDIANKQLGDDYITALNLAPATPDWLSAIGATPMKLGLDLRGGVHFLLAVDINAALDKTLNDLVPQLRSQLRDAGIRYRSIEADTAAGLVKVMLRTTDDVATAKALIAKQDRGLLLTRGPDDLTLQLSLTEQRVKDIREYALEQNISIIRNRINDIGVAEPLVQRQGADRIVVQLPGVQDTAQAKETLGATASLELTGPTSLYLVRWSKHSTST